MFRDSTRQQFGLIEAAAPAPSPVQRHRDDEVIAAVDRQRTIQQSREPGREGTHAGILEQMDQISQRALVETEAGGVVKAQEAGAAKRANAVGIQRETVLKRRVAGGAKEIGFERLWFIQAVVANRHTRKSCQRGVADAALGGKKKLKNSVRDRAEAGSGRSR